MDLSNVTLRCGSDAEDVAISQIRDEEIFCTDVERLIVSYVLPIILVVLVLFAAIIVMLVYKERILIWLYAHPAIRKLFPVDLEDEDKNYDAFISYAEADSDYIANQLLPGRVYCGNLKSGLVWILRGQKQLGFTNGLFFVG